MWFGNYFYMGETKVRSYRENRLGGAKGKRK
jgi:hypothetical protein